MDLDGVPAFKKKADKKDGYTAMNMWTNSSISSNRSPGATRESVFKAKAHMNFMETLGRNR